MSNLFMLLFTEGLSIMDAVSPRTALVDQATAVARLGNGEQ